MNDLIEAGFAPAGGYAQRRFAVDGDWATRSVVYAWAVRVDGLRRIVRLGTACGVGMAARYRLYNNWLEAASRRKTPGNRRCASLWRVASEMRPRLGPSACETRMRRFASRRTSGDVGRRRSILTEWSREAALGPRWPDGGRSIRESPFVHRLPEPRTTQKNHRWRIGRMSRRN